MRIGFIGIGNMGSALLESGLKGQIDPASVGVTSLRRSHWEEVTKTRKVRGFASSKELVEWAVNAI
ncbi:MAG: NAD(P)-binding domain-containing protein [Clostridia bacterium]|nr:NAD(P)-binding domain-containing protein [Clostridia bacterium]